MDHPDFPYPNDLVTTKECMKLMGLTRYVLWRTERENPDFPKRVIVPGVKKPCHHDRVFWYRKEIVEWMAKHDMGIPSVVGLDGRERKVGGIAARINQRIAKETGKSPLTR